MTPNPSLKNRTRSVGKNPLTGGLDRREILSLAALLALSASSAMAAEKTYRYYRFEPVAMIGGNTQIQLSEFTFSVGGNLINLNNRDQTGVNVVNVTVAAGAQQPDANEGPIRVTDGDLNTKWFTNNGLTDPLDFSFEVPVAIDSYNFATANDSVEFNRTPVSWYLWGSDNIADPNAWVMIDVRTNEGLNNVNFTYQAGFTLPDIIPPTLYRFGVVNSPYIIKDGQSFPLQWNIQGVDPGTVAITPFPGAVAPAGQQVITPSPSTTTTYRIEGSSALGSIEASTTVRTVAGGSSSFRYVRFIAKKLRAGGPDGEIQIAELELYNGATKLTPVTATNAGGSNLPTALEGVNKLVDGDVNTKWFDGNNEPVIFDIGNDGVFDNYRFVTANDSMLRDPIQWTFEGSDDQTNWTLIENVDFDYAIPAARYTSTGSIPLPGASLPPAVDFFGANGSTVIQGEPVTLSWTTTGAGTFSIDQGIGAVAADGSTPITPPLGTTTYTLTATSPGGIAASTRTFEVTVIEPPAITTIDYADFSASNDELTLQGSAGIVDGRLRLTPDIGGQRGEAWFRTKQNVGAGFEATFGLSMNHPPNTFVPADGVAFVVQNSPAGSSAQSSGENGVATNSLNIKFRTFGFNLADASQMQVIAGTTVLHTAVLGTTPGIKLTGVPGHPYTTGTVPGAAPYQVRVTYVPGDLDVYVDGVAVAQNINVDLSAPSVAAVDGSGKAFVGFSARTGGNTQNSDITEWHVKSGNFSALPPFSLVKSFYNTTFRAGDPVPPKTFDIVWNAQVGTTYNVRTSTNLTSWTNVNPTPIVGVNGQLGIKVDAPAGSKSFFRIEEVP